MSNLQHIGVGTDGTEEGVGTAGDDCRRIAHVVSTFPPYHAGMGNAAKEIAERVAARGHEVVVVTPSTGHPVVQTRDAPLDAAFPAPEISNSRLQILRIHPWLRYGNAAWCPSMARCLEGLMPDIVHLHWPFVGGIASVIAWRRRRPQRRLVVHYHMDLVDRGWRGLLFSAYQAWELRRLLPVADRVVVSSLDYARHGRLAQWAEQLGDRLVEISFGVDAGRFHPEVDTHPPVPSLPFTILFVGGLDRAHAFKGVPVLLDAIARAPDVHLRLVGDGDLRPMYAHRAWERGIADRVEFLGHVADRDLLGVYRAVDVLVLPSTARSEAFGIVLLEAMASGVPVIASDLPGVRTVVADEETGFLVPPGDAPALADCLRRLAINPELRRRMGDAGRRWVEERYAWDRVIDAWCTLYASVRS